jgi:predicted enzyme related to lactoylglutathione lyase
VPLEPRTDAFTGAGIDDGAPMLHGVSLRRAALAGDIRFTVPADVAHVLTILAVDDLPTSVAFYRRAFSWELTVEVAVYAEFALPGGMRLGLYEREGFGRNTGAAPIAAPAGSLLPTELYFHAAALEETLGDLEAAGARLLSPLAPRPWGDEVAYFADPSGNVLALARPLTNASAAR